MNRRVFFSDSDASYGSPTLEQAILMGCSPIGERNGLSSLTSSPGSATAGNEPENALTELLVSSSGIL